MKKSVVAALAAAVVAIPIAAEAATYTPISFNTPRGDVRDSGGGRASAPSIDITGISGHRYAGNFQIKVYFNDLAQTRYVRRLVYLSDDAATDKAKTTIIESRVSSDPAVPVADVVVAYSNGATAYKRCPGVHGSVDYRGNTITYTLPTECYVNVDRDSAYLGAFSGQFHQATWRNAPYSTSQQPRPDFFDNGAYKTWRWRSGSRSLQATQATQPAFSRAVN